MIVGRKRESNSTVVDELPSLSPELDAGLVTEEPSPEVPPAVAVQIQLAPPRSGYVATRLEISRMTYSQIMGLHLLVSSLDKYGAVLSNGVRVTSGVDAVRWVAEQFAKGLPEGWKPENYK